MFASAQTIYTMIRQCSAQPWPHIPKAPSSSHRLRVSPCRIYSIKSNLEGDGIINSEETDSEDCVCWIPASMRSCN